MQSFTEEVTTLGNSPNSPADSAASYREKREAPRYTFVATTDLTDSAGAIQLSGRISEISRLGCYVDSLNALPVGTLLNVRISRDRGTFETKGKIVYVHERIGMGVAFVDSPEEQMKILDAWLAELPPTAAL